MWIGRERFAGGRQHSDYRLIEPAAHLLHDLRGVQVGTHGVECDTRFRTPHFGLKKCGYEGGCHVSECFALLLLADAFNRLGHRDEVTLQGRP